MSEESVPASRGRTLRLRAGLFQAVGPNWIESLLWGTAIFAFGSLPGVFPVLMVTGWAVTLVQSNSGRQITVPFDHIYSMLPVALFVGALIIGICSGACLIIARLRGLKLFPMFLVAWPMFGLTGYLFFLLTTL